MLLLIDNYDSFTYNLVDYFLQLGEDVTVVRNDEVDEKSIYNHTFDKLVISPGPNTPDESGNLMNIIPAVYDRCPILGICLGHQALGQFFGASLCLAHKPMHGKTSVISHNGEGIYKGLPGQIEVCRYHSLLLEDIDAGILNITAKTSEEECMSYQHRYLPVTGIQYHPEAILTTYGLQILDNWLKSTV